MILFGIPSRPVEMDVAEAMIFKNLQVLALNGRRIFETWYKTRWMLESGVVDLSPLITHKITLDQMEDALSELREGKACKIVVYPGKTPSVKTPRTIKHKDQEEPEKDRAIVQNAKWSHR